MPSKSNQNKLKAETIEEKTRIHSMQLRCHKKDIPQSSIKAETSYFSSSSNDIKPPNLSAQNHKTKVPTFCSEKQRNNCKNMQINKKAKKTSLQLEKENFSIKMKLYKFLKQQRLKEKQ